MHTMRNKDSSNADVILAQYLQYKSGATYYIEKALTDELELVDMKDLTSQNLCWPSHSCEFVFEDSSFPACLFTDKTKIAAVALEINVLKINRPDDATISLLWWAEIEKGVALPEASTEWIRTYEEATGDKSMRYSAGKYHVYHGYTEEVLDLILSGASGKDCFTESFSDDEELNELELEVGDFLIRMIVKILLYISIPKYKPYQVPRRKIRELTHRYNRPDRPVYKVINLPSTAIINSPSATHEGGIKCAHRRRGHIRTLRSSKYTHKQGQLIYVAPSLIHGGSTEDKLYYAHTIH
jgi:hypothetical protein